MPWSYISTTAWNISMRRSIGSFPASFFAMRILALVGQPSLPDPSLYLFQFAAQIDALVVHFH
jgi:hypothetical protein